MAGKGEQLATTTCLTISELSEWWSATQCWELTSSEDLRWPI